MSDAPIDQIRRALEVVARKLGYDGPVQVWRPRPTKPEDG
jgi:hypothetical protein